MCSDSTLDLDTPCQFNIRVCHLSMGVSLQHTSVNEAHHFLTPLCDCNTPFLTVYAYTFLEIKALVCKSVSLQKLKAQIENQFPYLEENIEFAQTKEEVMTQFRKQLCKFPCFVELHRLVHDLQLYEAVKEVDKFDEKRSEVYETISARGFPKIEPEAYKQDQNVQVGKNVIQTILKRLSSIHNSFFLHISMLLQNT